MDIPSNLILVAGPDQAFIVTGRKGKPVKRRDRGSFDRPLRASLTGQGLTLDTFQIQDITDDGSYLSDLGRPEAARVGQLAAIAEASAQQNAAQALIRAEQEIAVSQRVLALEQSEIKAETDAAQAQAAAAGPLAQADRDQAILTEQEKVAVRQAALKERQLDSEVRKPADAERYRVETDAQGRRNAEIFSADARKAASIAAAEAAAEESRLTGVGDKSRRTALAEADAIEGAKRGEAEKARRVAEAQATEAEGDAQAAAILATGEAEAAAMEKKAAAFAHYSEAAVLQMLIEVLPKMGARGRRPDGVHRQADGRLHRRRLPGAQASHQRHRANHGTPAEHHRSGLGGPAQAVRGLGNQWPA